METMRDLVGKVVLLGQAYFEKYSGSEIVTLEIAESYAARGARVLIACRTRGEPIINEVAGQDGIEVYDWASAELDAIIRESDLYLAWIQHHVIPPALFLGDAATPTIFAHLSAIHPLEFPLLDAVEETLASLVVFTSPEARDEMTAAGSLLGVPSDRVEIFPNPAPSSFHRQTSSVSAGPPWRICVVSNHPPEELTRALELLDDRFEVVRIGRRGGPSSTVQRVDADLIDSVHAVITIGKTVQYALVRGRAVFCYDHFGGPGWLTAENIEAASRRNYSGRGYEKMAAEAIAHAIREGIEDAQMFAGGRVEHSRGQYDLDATLRKFEEIVHRQSRSTNTSLLQLTSEHIRIQQLVTRLSKDWSGADRAAATEASARRRAERRMRSAEEKTRLLQSALDERNERLRHLEEELGRANTLADRASQEIGALRDQLTDLSLSHREALAVNQAMENTLSWKITSPLRAMRRVFAPGRSG